MNNSVLIVVYQREISLPSTGHPPYRSVLRIKDLADWLRREHAIISCNQIIHAYN